MNKFEILKCRMIVARTLLGRMKNAKLASSLAGGHTI